jgi:hypothetical protein
VTLRTSQFQLPVELEYIETTIPPGMGIAEYRRSRRTRSSWWRRLLLP